MKNCKFCGEEIFSVAVKCKHCGEFLDKKVARGNDDILSGGWIIFIWLSLFIPYIGGTIIILVSSVMYHSWKNDFPKKANSINRHGWLAFITGIVIWFFFIGSFAVFLDYI